MFPSNTVIMSLPHLPDAMGHFFGAIGHPRKKKYAHRFEDN